MRQVSLQYPNQPVIPLIRTGYTGKTSFSSWTVVEPAIEVFSGCLPTMAPLLQVGKYLKRRGWTCRSPFTLRRSKPGQNSTEENRNQRNRELRLRPDVTTNINSDATAKRSESAVEDDDLVPLHSILVRRDLVFVETRR